MKLARLIKRSETGSWQLVTPQLIGGAVRQPRRTFLTGLSVVAGSVSCTGPTVPSDAEPVPYVLLADEISSGVYERARMVIRDEASYEEFWNELTAPTRPHGSAPLPEINFSRQTVIAAAMGTRGSSGFSIAIDGVYRKSSKLYVAVHEHEMVHCVVLTVVTNPVIAIAVEFNAGEVVFVEEHTVHECTG